MKRALAALALACGHPAPHTPPRIENVAIIPDAAAAPDGGDDCEIAEDCWVARCRTAREGLEIDAGTSCDEDCVADGVRSGKTEALAEDDCTEDCICGE